MEHNAIKKTSDLLSPPASETIIVAINGKKNSKYVVEWTLKNLLRETTTFKLLYVSAKITSLPTPMEIIPISQVPEDTAAAYRQEIEWNNNELLDIYKKMFMRKKVPVDVVIVEGDNIAQAIADEVDKGHVNKLVIGESSRGGMFTRKINGENYSSKIKKMIPSFCTVYTVSKGKLSSERKPSSEIDGSISSFNSSLNSSFNKPNKQTGRTDANALSSPPSDSDISISSQAPTSSFQYPYIPSEHEMFLDLEIQSLKIELQRYRVLYAEAQSETREAYRKLNDMTKSRCMGPDMPKDTYYLDGKSKDMVKPETEDEKGEGLRKKENLQETTFGTMQQYNKVTLEEIMTATSSFSENLIIGQGPYGTVYKCNLHSTTAAVKVLHSRELQNSKQFQQELEILSRIRNPYLLLLLGACPEQGCLVYEYMENGSLEDRLFRRNNQTAPIPWFDRIRIAWEIASGLVFLHHSKPSQIIHRDLKPANILLDHNLGSKIGNFGLSKTVHSAVEASAMPIFNQTTLVGTLSYIDPEYQRTGENSPKSDVYAFGMILLQLLTAKTATTLTHLVETAVKAGNLMKLLDPKAGPWPLEEAKELAILGLSCAELRRIDRPDLKDHVLPKLEILRAAADRARDAVHNSLSAPPTY